MGLHVLVEVLLHVEVLAAPLAHELLVSDVDAHVGAQLVLVLEPLVAVLQRGTGARFRTSSDTSKRNRLERGRPTGSRASTDRPTNALTHRAL